MWRDPIGRVRVVGMLEAVSFVVLLGIAMPLKYFADMPLAVRIAGITHGTLFIALAWLVTRNLGEIGWSNRRALYVMVAALLPFGPFAIDARLAEEQKTRQTTG